MPKLTVNWTWKSALAWFGDEQSIEEISTALMDALSKHGYSLSTYDAGELDFVELVTPAGDDLFAETRHYEVEDFRTFLPAELVEILDSELTDDIEKEY